MRYMQDQKFNTNSRKQLGIRMPANILPLIAPIVAAAVNHDEMRPAQIALIDRPEIKFAGTRNRLTGEHVKNRGDQKQATPVSLCWRLRNVEIVAGRGLHCVGPDMTRYKIKKIMGHIIAFDLDTTGLSPKKGHRVIEVGAVRIEGGRPGAAFRTFIDAGRPVVKRARRINGITDAMLRRGPSPGEALRKFRVFCGNATLVAHNAPFDKLFLQYEYSRFGWGFMNQVICTLRLSRQKIPDLPNYRMATVARHLLGDSA